MAEIKCIDRGNGLTELIVVEGEQKKVLEIKRHKKSKLFAWVFLTIVLIDLMVGVFVAPFTTKSMLFYVVYWTQAIGLCGLWAFANFAHTNKKTPAETSAFRD